MARTTLARRRLVTQRLLGAPFSKPEAAVEWLGAVQAQDYAGVKWALGQRVKEGVTDRAIESAIDDGAIVRTHVLRPTWHLVMPADLRWMLALSAPRIHAASASYYRKNELDGRTFARSEAVLGRALRCGQHLTRAELAKALASAGIASSGLRLGLLMMHAELEAVICSGPRRGKQFTYALVDERVPATRPWSRERSLSELTLRYFQSHGPARAQDFAGWSGLTLTDAKLGIELAGASLAKEVVDGKDYWSSPPERRASRGGVSVHLLPNYDEYLIAYKDGVAVDAETVRKLDNRSGVLSHHVVVVQGRVIGSWRRLAGKASVVVETRLLERLDDATEQDFRGALDRYAGFLETTVTWRKRR